jgi:hypothetical protein
MSEDGVAGASNVTSTNSSAQVRSCNEWDQLFSGINNYFRSDDILQGSEHSSTEVCTLYYKLKSDLIFSWVT